MIAEDTLRLPNAALPATEWPGVGAEAALQGEQCARLFLAGAVGTVGAHEFAVKPR